MVKEVVPRCLIGISPETLKKLKKLLAKEQTNDSELRDALDRLIDLTDDELDAKDE